MGIAREEANIIKIKAYLRACNYAMLPDFAGTNKNEWINYRKALRDLPKDPNWPDVDFPSIPDEPPLKIENIENGDI